MEDVGEAGNRGDVRMTVRPSRLVLRSMPAAAGELASADEATAALGMVSGLVG